jgi:hypothetical protein
MIKIEAYEKVLAMAKEAIDTMLIPVRVIRARKNGEYELAKMDEEIATKEARVSELITQKEVDFHRILDALDDVALLERRRKKMADLLKTMFPVVLLLLLFSGLTTVNAQDLSHGSSVQYGNLTLYQDGTMAMKQGDNTLYSNGQIDTTLSNLGATYHYIPPQEEVNHGGYGSSIQLKAYGSDETQN